MTQGPTRFLLNLYMTTLDPVYREPLLKALNFILMSQYPNGAWPQRYPLRYDQPSDGFVDYTSYYTLTNDDVMPNIMDVLVEAYEKLGNEEYLKAALRGADFIINAQMPEPQAGWADQYDMDMKPAWARTHEASSIVTRGTTVCIETLEKFFLMTGDRRYLSPIPAAIKWLESATLEISSDGKHQLTENYELGTNKPIYPHQNQTGQVDSNGYATYIWDYNPENDYRLWSSRTFDIEAIKREFKRLSALTSEHAVAEYKAKKAVGTDIKNINPETVSKLISSLGNRNAWIEDISVDDVNLITKYPRPERQKIIKGYSTRTFLRNMNILIKYLKSTR